MCASFCPYDGKKQLIWRGTAKKTIDPGTKPEKRQKNIENGAAKLLKNYPRRQSDRLDEKVGSIHEENCKIARLPERFRSGEFSCRGPDSHFSGDARSQH